MTISSMEVLWKLVWRFIKLKQRLVWGWKIGKNEVWEQIQDYLHKEWDEYTCDKATTKWGSPCSSLRNIRVRQSVHSCGGRQQWTRGPQSSYTIGRSAGKNTVALRKNQENSWSEENFRKFCLRDFKKILVLTFLHTV